MLIRTMSEMNHYSSGLGHRPCFGTAISYLLEQISLISLRSPGLFGGADVVIAGGNPRQPPEHVCFPLDIRDLASPGRRLAGTLEAGGVLGGECEGRLPGTWSKRLD